MRSVVMQRAAVGAAAPRTAAPKALPLVPGRPCMRPLPVAAKPSQRAASHVMRAAVADKPATEKAEPHWKQALAKLDVPKDSPARKTMVVQVAPAVRAAIGECFGIAPGSVDQAKPTQMVEGLRRLGFDVVLDLTFGADVTIMEEATELLHRLTEHLGEDAPHDDHPLPMFTSCCPGWISLVEKSYPELIPYLSTCKSPQMMLGTLIKTYMAELRGLKPSEICVVSIMPCVRKQGEADREWFAQDDCSRDVDHVITTAELGTIMKERGIDLPNLPESEWDQLLGNGSGAGVLFGTTGGVMEAALRTAYEVVTQEELQRLEFQEVRGLEGIKESTVTLKPPPGSAIAKLLEERSHKKKELAAVAAEGKHPIVWKMASMASMDGSEAPPEAPKQITHDSVTLRVAVANGLGNAKKLITKMQSGETHYDFIEVMACPAGCISGAGQPRSADKQITQKRQQVLYTLDERQKIRRSHKNPLVAEVYEKFLGTPDHGKAHELMHTHYVPGGPGGAAGSD